MKENAVRMRLAELGDAAGPVTLVDFPGIAQLRGCVHACAAVRTPRG
jgi:hypothetical protein